MSTRNPDKIKQRNDAIVKRFKELIDKKTPKGKCVHSYAYCIERVADEFYLSERWVQFIILNHE